MRFKFVSGAGARSRARGGSGYLAFTGPVTARLLLLTDAGHYAVHVIDVAGQAHVGYVAAPGTIAGPLGVAARGSLVAVSAWQLPRTGDHVVRLFEGSGASWTAVRVLAGGFGGPGSADGQLYRPRGLRFTADGTGLVVADCVNNRVCLFRVGDGSFERHVATEVDWPYDVEECADGWLVACLGSNSIESVRGGGDAGGYSDARLARLGRHGSGHGEFISPCTLALVPDLGLVVRENDNGGCCQVFASPDAIAMASMSACRVAWMVGVVRGTARRALTVRTCTGVPRGKQIRL